MRFLEVSGESFADYGQPLSPKDDLVRALEQLKGEELRAMPSSRVSQMWQYAAPVWLIPHGIGFLVIRSEAGFLRQFLLLDPVKLHPGVWFAVHSPQADFSFHLHSDAPRQVMQAESALPSSPSPKMRLEQVQGLLLRHQDRRLSVQGAGYRHWQLFYICQGGMNFRVVEQEFSLRQGQLLLVPPGRPTDMHKVTKQLRMVLLTFEARFPQRFSLAEQVLPVDDQALALLRQLEQELEEGLPYYEDQVTALTNQLMVSLLRGRLLPKSPKKQPELPQNQVVETCLQIIEQNLSTKLTRGYLARKCGVSDSTLLNLFKQEMGMGVAEYIKLRRLRKARSLLEEGSYGVTQVSDMLGYCSVCYFSSEFKAQFGQSPSDFVRVLRAGGEAAGER